METTAAVKNASAGGPQYRDCRGVEHVAAVPRVPATARHFRQRPRQLEQARP